MISISRKISNDQIDILNAKLENVISQKQLLINVGQNLDKEFAELGNEENDLALVIKANSIKRKNEKKEVQSTPFERQSG